MKKNISKILYIMAITSYSSVLFAETTQTSHGAGVDDFLAYFLALGLAAAAGTIAQSMVISKALDGIARNPGATERLFVPMILGLALIESLIIFTFVSVFMVQ